MLPPLFVFWKENQVFKSSFSPFILVSLFGSLMVLSSPNPLVMWVGVEISSFFFVPILQSSSSVGAWKYFLTQGLSSFFLFIGFVSGEGTNVDLMWIFISLVVKLGLFPFFGWVIHLSSNVSWFSFFLLGSVQKVPPLLFLAKNSESLSSLFSPLITLSMMVTGFFFLSKFPVRWMMMFSSIFNVGWLSLAALLGIGSLGMYMFIYFLLNLTIINLLKLEESSSFTHSFKVSEKENVKFILGLFFMMGLPPFGTFVGKVEILSFLENLGYGLPCLVIIFISSVIMLFYFKICMAKSFFTPSFSNLKMFSSVVSLSWLIVLVPLFALWQI